MILYYAGIAFTVATAVTCVRRGQANPWIWIILFFPPIGGAVYLFTEVLGSHSFRGLTHTRAASKREVKVAQAEVTRLDNSEAWTSLAQALRSRKQFEEARQAAATAIDRDPTSWRALNELGLAQMGLGDYENASTTLAHVVEIEPAHAAGDAAFALAVSLEKSGQKDQARQVLEKLARTSSLPKVLFSLASLQADAGKTSDARASLERIITEADYVPSYHRREVRPWVRRAKKALTSLGS
jgi:hypothetical protein